MRVALVAFNHGEYCIRLASALARDAEVLLALPAEQAYVHSAALDPAVTFYPFPTPRLRHASQQLANLKAIRQQIRRFSPDVVHLQQGQFWFNLSLPLLRCPLVLTIHDVEPHPGDKVSTKTPQWLNKYAYRRADRIIVHTEHVKRVLLDKISVGEEHLSVIPHIKLGEEREQPNCSDDGRTVLFFGRIWPYKGLEYLIAAEPLITAAIPDAKIVIAGEGEDFSRYRRMMVHPENFVVHNRRISDPERNQFFQQASVLALPYIEATQSGVVPLAYTFGKPVVATTVGGLPETVEDNWTGFCVPPRDTNALAHAIVRLLKDQMLRNKFGVNGNRKINRECSAEVIAKKTLDVYHAARASSR